MTDRAEPRERLTAPTATHRRITDCIAERRARAAHRRPTAMPRARAAHRRPTAMPLPSPSPLRLGLVLLALAACSPAPAPSRATGDPAAAASEDPAGTLARIAREPEGKSRQPLFRALRRGPADQVLPALRAALADPDPALRAAAAAAAGRRDDGLTLLTELLALATGDLEGPVRVAATRSLAQLRAVEAFEPLRINLGHAVPETRLSALRALARIDAARAAELSELGRLQLDPDPRIAGAATKVARGVSPM